MRSYVRLLTPDDEEEVLNLSLRQADIDEVVAATGKTVREVLRDSLNVSDYAWGIMLQGELIGVFGISSLYGHGVPWLLATDRLSEMSYVFLKYSWDALEIMLDMYPTLFNFVDSRNTQAIQWLKWLGFQIIETPVFLHDKTVPFYQFVMYRGKDHP